jgi:hypothetical protein
VAPRELEGRVGREVAAAARAQLGIEPVGVQRHLAVEGVEEVLEPRSDGGRCAAAGLERDQILAEAGGREPRGYELEQQGVAQV